MLKGKVAVVTGGSRGIGRAVCIELAKQGADVAFLYAGNEAAAEETLALLSAYDVKSAAYRCDVSDTAQVRETFRSLTEAFQTVDILVNNAGINKDKLAMTMREEEFEQVIDINLSGAFKCAKQVIPLMVKKRSGKIINISSVAGLIGNAGQSNYAAAKAGLIGLTKTLAKELAARNITCNAVAPGFVETDMTAALPLNREAVEKSIPLHRFAKAEEVAKLVGFLASDGADYITGEVIRIDGGIAI